MRTFHRFVAYDANDTLAEVIDYQLDGFDHTIFWEGRFLSDRVPNTVRLLMGDGKAGDFVVNPLSWPVCSERMVSLLASRAAHDIQLFDAPLIDAETKVRIPGYKIVNVIRRVACLDVEKSEISYEQDQPTKIFVIYTIAIDSTKVDPNIHLFRLEAWPYTVIVSDELARDFAGRGFSGIAFEKCKTTR
jgi:hypothetical protein